jgi:flavin reductase (DIM6/NTAB) family NADH-FMN oxidoreductase RutF
VGVPRVAESPVSFECRLSQLIQLQRADGEQVPTWLVLGEVVGVHIARSLLKDGVYDTAAAEPILRGGGPADYFTIGREQLFRMFRPG